MVERLRVATVVGTRPEVVKLSRILPALDRATEHVLVHTGQNGDPELNGLLFDDLGLRPPDHLLGVSEPTPARTVAEVIRRTDELLETVRPDALLIYGDTNSGLAALAAKKRKIPLFHMEAGNRCFDERTPEEVNRRLLDHLADVNLVLSESARRNLLAEGRPADRIFKTGSPMPEVLDHYRPRIDASDIVPRLGLSPGSYYLVSAHREENVDAEPRLSALLSTLRALASRGGRRVIVSTHPRTRRRLEESGLGTVPGVELFRPFGFLDWVKLQENAFCVLSDSGTLTEEAALLGFPAVMIREAHERPEGMDAGVAVMAGLATERVLQAVALVTDPASRGPATRVGDYENRNVSRQVVRILLSYTDYVRRTVWGEPV